LWNSVGGVMVIPLEDANSLALLPVLETLAAASSAGKIQVIHPDLHREDVSRGAAAFHLVRMLGASISSLRSARRCRRELAQLLDSPRIDVTLPRKAGDVLYLKTNLWFGVKAGGSVGHIAGVVNGLLDHGYGLVFAAAEEPVMLKSGARYLRVDPPKVFGLPSELNYYRFQEMFTAQVGRSADSIEPDFIYQRLSVANYAGVILSRQFHVPLVLEYNGSEAWIAKHWGNPLRYHDLAVMAEDASLRHAHLVVTISDVLRDELLERGVAPERIVVYPNCVDPEVFDPERYSREEIAAVRREHGIAMDARLVTFVGTFGQWHGAEILAKAIRRLVEKDLVWLEQRKVHFMLVGDGLRMPEVRKEINGREAERFVTLTGLVEQQQAPRYLAASDILVSPHVPNTDGSRFFGSPTKLFEYMAMGKGIVASELEQIGEVLSPGLRASEGDQDKEVQNESAVAVLTTPGDVDDLVRGIRLLVEHPDLCERLGKNARRKVLDHYTWKHHVDAIIKGLKANTLVG
ncbi:MAG: glycosyltransferase WbuB, partial [Acidobacteria bacterium]